MPEIEFRDPLFLLLVLLAPLVAGRGLAAGSYVQFGSLELVDPD